MILITGATGYIGSHLLEYLSRKKINCICIDNLSYSYKSNINKKNNLFYNIDIGNRKKIENILKKFKINTVVHAAAASYVIEGERYKKKYFYNNVKKTKNFVDLCKENNVENFIFLSSSNVYDEKNFRNGFSEKSKLNPKNNYGKTKLIIEKYLHKKNFKNIFILRLFNVAGIFNKKFKIYKFKKVNYQRLIFKMVQILKKNQSIKINYKIKNKKKIFPGRDFISINDVVKIIHILLNKSKKQNQLKKIINIGSGKIITLNEIIFHFSKEFNKKLKVNYMLLSKKELLNTRANINLLKKFTNYSPKDNVKKIILSHKKYK